MSGARFEDIMLPMSSGDSWSLGHRPALDGLRGVAILLVMLTHTGFSRLQGAGAAGVTMFFTLSGFLIATMLLGERATSGRVSLRRFYIRRARRLAPALLLFLAPMGLLAMTPLPVAPSWRDLLGVLTGVGNFTVAMAGHDTVVTQTWSLSVEQQFYVVWPLLMVVALWLGRGRLAVLAMVTVGAVVLSIIERLLLWDDGSGALRVYVGTDTRLDGLLVGCLAGMWVHGRTPGTNRPRVAAAALAVIVALSLTTGVGAIVVVPTVVPWLCVAAILALTQQNREGWLTHRAIRLAGERSYGLFLWHYPLWAAALALPGPAVVPGFVAAVLLAFGIAHLSWHCVEMPFMRGRSRPSGDGVLDRPVGTSERSDVRLSA